MIQHHKRAGFIKNNAPLKLYQRFTQSVVVLRKGISGPLSYTRPSVNKQILYVQSKYSHFIKGLKQYRKQSGIPHQLLSELLEQQKRPIRKQNLLQSAASDQFYMYDQRSKELSLNRMRQQRMERSRRTLQLQTTRLNSKFIPGLKLVSLLANKYSKRLSGMTISSVFQFDHQLRPKEVVLRLSEDQYLNGLFNTENQQMVATNSRILSVEDPDFQVNCPEYPMGVAGSRQFLMVATPQTLLFFDHRTAQHSIVYSAAQKNRLFSVFHVQDPALVSPYYGAVDLSNILIFDVRRYQSPVKVSPHLQQQAPPTTTQFAGGFMVGLHPYKGGSACYLQLKRSDFQSESSPQQNFGSQLIGQSCKYKVNLSCKQIFTCSLLDQGLKTRGACMLALQKCKVFLSLDNTGTVTAQAKGVRLKGETIEPGYNLMRLRVDSAELKRVFRASEPIVDQQEQLQEPKNQLQKCRKFINVRKVAAGVLAEVAKSEDQSDGQQQVKNEDGIPRLIRGNLLRKLIKNW